MHTYELTLKTNPIIDYYTQRAANSVDLDLESKLTHKLSVEADIETDYNIAVIVGNSGSGKSTLAKHIWGNDVFKTLLDSSKPVISQFPEHMTYDDRVNLLNSAGLTAPISWVSPAGILSNGQQARAEIALQLAQDNDIIVIDEWTSVVDRTVAKVMSHNIQKLARRMNKKIVLLSCHFDIIDWVNPDWVIDCNKQEYVNRRLLCRRHTRSEKLVFSIRRLPDTSCWRAFSRYHYLSEKLPGGKNYCFGLFHGEDQIGMILFSNYVLHKQEHKDKGIPMILHANRVVIHPDYCGFGLGTHLLDTTSEWVKNAGFDVLIKLSSVSLSRQLFRNSKWSLKYVVRNIKNIWANHEGRQGRQFVKTYSFKYM